MPLDERCTWDTFGSEMLIIGRPGSMSPQILKKRTLGMEDEWQNIDIPIVSEVASQAEKCRSLKV